MPRDVYHPALLGSATAGTGLSLSDGVLTATGGGGGAPTDVSYLVLAASSDLSAERRLIGEATVVSVTDAGANSTVTIGLATAGVTYAKIQDISATDRLLGRSTAGAGVIEEIVCTAAGRALIDDAAASNQRTTLGLGTLATQSGTFSGTSSGTNTGDQTITLTGDVTGSGTGSFAATIAAAAVTLAKMANIATDRLIGRDTAGTGVPEALTVTGGLEFTDAGGIQRSALTGDVTASAGSNATTIANDAVTYAKIQNVSATSRALGRNTAGAGDTEEVTATQILDWVGTTRGSVLYKGASGWAILAPGTSGFLLKSGGSGADPSYAAYNPVVVALTDGANIATDAALGDVFTVTLAGNRTMDNPTNPVSGKIIRYRITQDGTGSRTITWGSAFRGSTDQALPTLTTTASKTDYIAFMYNAADSKWDCLAANKGF